MINIETGNAVWCVDTGMICSIISSSNGSIYASGYDKKQLLKIDAESGNITELFPIVGSQFHIAQYRLCHSQDLI